MANYPLISIVLPLYNGRPFIEETLRSVEAQTLSDAELVLIDDGSTDETAGVIQSFRDARLTYVHQENQDAYNLEATNNIRLEGNKRVRGFVGIRLLQPVF